MTSEKFVCCHFWTTPVFEAERGRSDGRHPQSHQCSVTRQLTYLPYNYLDFFVTPVVAGTGTGGGEGIFINKQLKSATSYIYIVCGLDTREVTANIVTVKLFRVNK